MVIPIIHSSLFAFGYDDEISMITAMNKFLDITSMMEETQPLKSGERVYLDSLENGQFISVYGYPGMTWKSCNEMQKKHQTKFVDCEAVGWLDRNSFVFTLKDQSNRIITETRDEMQSEFVYDEKTDRKYVVPKNIKVSYSKIYFKYSRKVKKDGVEKNFDNEGVGWIPTELLSSELHKPFYRAAIPTPNPTPSRVTKPAPPVPTPPISAPRPVPTPNVKSDPIIVLPQQKPTVPGSKNSFQEHIKPPYPPIKSNPYISQPQSSESKVEVLPKAPVAVLKQTPPQQVEQPASVSPGGAIPIATSISNMEGYLDAVDYIVGLLKSRLGVCIKPNFAKLSQTPYKNTYNPFDKLVLPKLNALDMDFINQINQNGSQLFLNQKVLLEDIVAIDALARTMYAEMGICYKNGLHYPMAVAKIALNRTRAEGKLFSSYTNEVPHADKSDLTKVLTTPSQFNAWIPKTSVIVEGRRLETSAFKQVLCPPISGDKPFYTGSKPNINEQNVWINSLRIATEAVLFSEEFKKRTVNIQGDHYSSGLKQKKWHGMTKRYPSIEGRKFSNEACMQIWMK